MREPSEHEVVHAPSVRELDALAQAALLHETEAFVEFGGAGVAFRTKTSMRSTAPPSAQATPERSSSAPMPRP